MKTLKTLLLVIAILASCTLNAQVAVTTDGSSADGSAMFEVKSTNKGLLPPRLTTTQRNAISSPVAGLTIYNTDKNCIEFYTGSYWRNLCDVIGSNDVLNPVTEQIWMDRNLGASQIATSREDAASYGDLYQWGRAADGHQFRTSTTTSTLATSNTPGHGNFILVPSTPNDWRNPKNNNLWQGVSGVNNPCPNGYRLPTQAEWDAERLSWSTSNSAGAFASPLKLPKAGMRGYGDGLCYGASVSGTYWSSTVSDTKSGYLLFENSYALTDIDIRAYGFSVRCLKE